MKRLCSFFVLFTFSLIQAGDEPKPLRLLTPGRIAALPESERGAWTAYLERSRERALAEREILAEECRAAGKEASQPAPNRSSEFEIDSDTPVEWFDRPENLHLATAMISYQTPTGGWSKAVDYEKGPRATGTHWTSQKGEGWHYCGTIDNRTTTEQNPVSRRSPHGHGRCRGEGCGSEGNRLPPRGPVSERRLAAGISRGKRLPRGGHPTVWCAQHDPLDSAPVKARAKEPPSLSGGESAEMVKFLMRRGPVTPELTAAIESAVKWFEGNRLTGLRKTKNEAGKTDYVPDPDSEEVYWARFYDLESGKPIFPGADDGISYPTHTEMAAKNKVAYDFMSTRPRDLLAKELPRWKKRLEKERG